MDNTNTIGSLLDSFITMVQDRGGVDSIWREEPVDLLTFFTSPDFLNETPYEGKQTEFLQAVNDIVMWKMSGSKECPENLRQVTEIVAMFGKGCKHGSTKIIDAETGELHTFYDLSQRGQDFYVTALNEDTQELVKAKACAPVRVASGDSYEITTSSGHKTTVYKDHLFLTRDYCKSYTSRVTGLTKYSGTRWVKASELKPGDSIALAQRVISEGTNTEDPKILRLLGYLIGDGNMSDANKYVSFYVSSDEVERDFCDILLSLGLEPKYPEYGNEKRPDRNCKMIVCSKGSVWENGTRENPVTEIARKYNLLGKTAYNKSIPKEIFTMTNECKVEFLKALYATDGWVCNPSGKVVQIGYCSVSHDLITDLQALLSTLGIMSRLYTKKTKSSFGVAYQLLINDEYNVRRFNDLIKIPGKEAKLQELIDRFYSGVGHRKGTDIYWTSVKSIDYVGEQDYYDLTVDEYANYVSDGFIDHNSGKDFLISGVLAWMAYLLCCLANPQKYFGFASDEPIDLINVAMNAYQANNVFFKKLKARLTNCKWFRKVNYNPTEKEGAAHNEFQITKNQIRFYRNITAHSAHSEADSFEGFNPLVAIFDEIGGFEMDAAENAYQTLKSSATSRYGSKSLMIFISFPRHTQDFIMQKYAEATVDKDPEVYAMKGASWEVNKRIKKEDFAKEYARDPEGARMRLECEPPEYYAGLFQFPEKVDEVIEVGKHSQCPNLVVTQKITTRTLASGEQRHFLGLELYNLELNPAYTYYLGGDCGVENDSYVISLFHAEPTLITTVEDGVEVTKWFNKPVEDLLLEWRPSKKDRLPVDLMNVADVLEQICRQVHVKKAIFDKFNSAEVVQRLMSYGVDAEDKNWSNPFQLQIYTNLRGLIYTHQISLLDHVSDDPERLNANEQLKHLRLINGSKIDHDPDKGKDFSDARAGAVWLCTMDEAESTTHFAMPVLLGTKRRG